MKLGLSKKILDLILRYSQYYNWKFKKIKKLKFLILEHLFAIKKREGRNPKPKVKVISARNVVLFKPSKDFKKIININD